MNEQMLRYTFDGSDPTLGGDGGYLSIPPDTERIRGAVEKADGTWEEVVLPWATPDDQLALDFATILARIELRATRAAQRRA